MKTILYFLLLTISFLQFGQVGINPKLGINFSNFSQHSDIFESSGTFGFTAGIDFKIGGKVYFSPGLFYVSSETEIKTFNNVNTDDVLEFHTIEMPLSIGLILFDKGDLKVGLKVGVEGAYFASISEVNNQADNIRELDEKDLERLGWGIHFGAGMDFRKITFDIEFDWGQNNSFTEDLADAINPSFNRTHLLVGYLF